MKIGNQEIEVATTPHMGDWMSIAYLPDGTVVAGARSDTQPMAEKDLYDKLADRFKPRFDPTRTYEAVDPDFDADEYMSSDDSPEEAVLRELRFKRYSSDGRVVTCWDRTEGDISMEVRRMETTQEWLVKGYVLDPNSPNGPTWKLVSFVQYHPDLGNLAEVIQDVEIACRFKGESVVDPDLDADEYMSSDDSPEEAILRELRFKLFTSDRRVAKCWERTEGNISIFVQQVQSANEWFVTGYVLDEMSNGLAWKRVAREMYHPDLGNLAEVIQDVEVTCRFQGESVEDPDFDADEYMSSPDPLSKVEAILQRLGFEPKSLPSEASKMWQRDKDGVLLNAHFNGDQWYAMAQAHTPEGYRFRWTAPHYWHPGWIENVSFEDMIEEVHQKGLRRLPSRVAEAVSKLLEDDPDFDADEYMATPEPDYGVPDALRSLGFLEVDTENDPKRMIFVWHDDTSPATPGHVSIKVDFVNRDWWVKWTGQGSVTTGTAAGARRTQLFGCRPENGDSIAGMVQEIKQACANLNEAVEEPEFDADEYMSLSPDQQLVQNLGFKEIEMMGQVRQYVLDLSVGSQLLLKNYEDNWVVEHTLIDYKRYAKTSETVGAWAPYHKGTLKDMLDKVIAKYKPVREAVDPDFDADEYMRNDNVSTSNEERVLVSMGFELCDTESDEIQNWYFHIPSGVHIQVKLLSLTSMASKWSMIGTLVEPGGRIYDYTPRLIWISDRDGDFKSAIDFTIACGEQRMNEAVEDPEFDADEYMAADSSSGLAFDVYLKRKGFGSLYQGNYSKQYSNHNVRVRIIVSMPMDIDGERDGSIFVEAKERTDYYQDYRTVFWKTWNRINPPEDVVNEVCDLASNPNGTLDWLRDAYKQYRERLGESVTEAEDPDFDADDYMGPASLGIEEGVLEAMGFRKCNLADYNVDRGDKAWQRVRNGTCISANYCGVTAEWSLTGSVHVPYLHDWRFIPNGSVKYCPFTGETLEKLIDGMQLKCDAAVESLQD